MITVTPAQSFGCTIDTSDIEALERRAAELEQLAHGLRAMARTLRTLGPDAERANELRAELIAELGHNVCWFERAPLAGEGS